MHRFVTTFSLTEKNIGGIAINSALPNFQLEVELNIIRNKEVFVPWSIIKGVPVDSCLGSEDNDNGGWILDQVERKGADWVKTKKEKHLQPGENWGKFEHR